MVADELPAQGRWAALLAECDRARRVARARCASTQDAEDCVQEALARVAAMPDVDLRRVGPLLATVTANLAADAHRTAARQRRALPRLRPALPYDPGPEEGVCEMSEAQWLWARRDALPPQDRAVLELRAAGSSTVQAAACLGLTHKAAESSFTRARARMRAIWQATAAAFGILLGRRPNGGRAATLGGATAAVVAAVTVLVVTASPDGASPEVVTAPPGEVTPVAPVPAPVSLDPPVAASPDRPSRSTSSTVAPPSTPAAPPLVSTRPLRTGVVGGFPVEVTRERGEESLPQTLERCLREGVVVSLTEINCRG